MQHRKKKVREFPVPSRDVTTKLSLGGNNDVITELFLPMGSLVSDIPAGDGKLVNLFLRCRSPVPKLSVHDSVCSLMEAEGVWDVGGRSVTVHV
jgi:hypothetical protein